jgi:hypothetical protein
MSSFSGFINRMKTEKSQGIKILITDQVDVATIATAPAVWPTFGDTILPPEADTAIAPSAGDQLNFYPINKQFVTCRRQGSRPAEIILC